MATRESIEFDFRKALAQANKIEAIAERLGRLSGMEFGNTMQNLSSGWKGENASLYLTKGSRLQEKMNGTVKELYSVASSIREIAKRIYDAEMAALEIASRRTY